MKREKVKSLVREILKTINERSKEAKARADKAAMQTGADQYSSRFLAQNPQSPRDLKTVGRGVQKGAGTATMPGTPARPGGGPKRDMTAMMSDPLQHRQAYQQGKTSIPGPQIGGSAAFRGAAVTPPRGQEPATTAAGQAAQQNLKKIPGTFGLYSATGAPPATHRSAKGQLHKIQPKGKAGAPRPLPENKILLKNLISENTYNRVNLMKIGALMEKALPELTKDQSKKLTELFTELSMMSTNMNGLPYTVKEYKLNEWQLLIASFHKKLDEFRSEVMKINEKSDKVNCAPLIKALDEALTY